MLENRNAETRSLNGEWQIEIGGQIGPVRVPGVWERQGYPADVNDATYTRTFDVPADWSGARVYLRFGAVSYFVEVVVNGVVVGTHEGLWTAFEFDVTDALQFGAQNDIQLRIVKPNNDDEGPYSYREVLVGFIPYISITFGGPWQDVELVAHRAPSLEVKQLSADLRTGAVMVKVTVVQFGDEAATSLITEVIDSSGATVALMTEDAAPDHTVTLMIHKPSAWSPESPARYMVRLRLEQGGQTVCEITRVFGFRTLAADGERLLLNGAPIFLRGILSWGWDPDTLAPTPTDDQIRDEFRRVRELGFNLIKLCLFVPLQRVFEIADEEGMLLWLELPMWYQRTTGHLREQAAVEYPDIMRAVHHHPSIVIYSLGCELGAEMADGDLLGSLNAIVRTPTRGVLVCDNSGSGEAYQGLNFDYADFSDYHFYCDLHQFVPLLDHFRRDWRPARPWIFGEYCDSDTYRTYSDARPWWRDVFGVSASIDRWAYKEQEQRMAANVLPFTDQQLIDMTYKQAFLVRKLTIERTRARRNNGGYVITGLRDTPITTSGVFDDANVSKFDPKAFRRFNDDDVLLLEQGRTRQWVNGGDRPAPTDLYNHFSGETVTFRVVLARTTDEIPETVHWFMYAPDGTEAVHTAQILSNPRPGMLSEINSLEITLPEVDTPSELLLEVTTETNLYNEWPLWIYPRVELTPDGVMAYDPAGQFAGLWPQHEFGVSLGLVIANVFDDKLEQYVRAGGRAIVLLPDGGSLPTKAVSFWRESIKLLYDHPVLNRFPHKGYADLQFYQLATDHAFDVFAGMDVTPVIRRLDARAFTVLDYLVDVRLGSGRMFASTLRFFGGAGDQVRGLSANPAGAYLLRLLMDDLLKDAT